MNGPFFKTITLDPTAEQGFRIVDLSDAQVPKISAYYETLLAARRSKVANPPFSNYFCEEAIMRSGGDVVPAGNIEYGFCQALHGEESAVAAFRASYARLPGPDIVLGMYSSDERAVRPTNPCGNCRDIMLEDLGKDFDIVCGNPYGETALVVPMSFYLFENYRVVSVSSGTLIEAVWETISEGKRIENDFYSPPDIHPRRKYYVQIRTANGRYFGAHDVGCDYHPIYALRDAVRQARRNNDPFVKEVWIVGEDMDGLPPDVMYKDRQALDELNLQQELVLGEKRDPQIFLVTCRTENGRPVQVSGTWKTRVKQWLPFPFTAANFMDLEAMAAYFKRSMA